MHGCRPVVIPLPKIGAVLQQQRTQLRLAKPCRDVKRRRTAGTGQVHRRPTPQQKAGRLYLLVPSRDVQRREMLAGQLVDGVDAVSRRQLAVQVIDRPIGGILVDSRRVHGRQAGGVNGHCARQAYFAAAPPAGEFRTDYATAMGPGAHIWMPQAF